ncbi:MAG: hypothetical protein ACRDKU_10010 [Gaiellaceae bacterium]
MDQAEFPWRPLGTLLVDEGLMSAGDVEHALAEQRRTGRLLGEIVVFRGYVSGVALARVLAKQHGVELRGAPGAPDPTPQAARPTAFEQGQTWRPLGKLLIERGFVTAGALGEALRAQAERPDRRLGEILVERGALSGRGLALALAEQHGVRVERNEFDHDFEDIAPSAQDGPRFEVWDVAYEPEYERRSVLYETTNLLEAADFACELVDRQKPEALEIRRRTGSAAETVWTYSDRRAAEVSASRTRAVDRLGFDPVRWNVSR